MNFDVFKATASKWITDNSPSILTGIGVAGTLTTAILAGKASLKAAEVIRLEEDQRNYNGYEFKKSLDNKPLEKFKLVWTLYIPSVTAAGLTIAAIIGANQVGLRRTAAMAAAFQTSQGMFSEYKQKVVDRVGDNKEQAIRDEIAQDRVNRRPVGSQEVIITGGGDSLCYDHYSGRYFRASMETIKKAMNDVNYQVLNHGDIALSEFYNKLGLSGTMFANDVGWNSMDILEVRFSTTMSDDDQPCISIEYDVVPIRGFHPKDPISKMY